MTILLADIITHAAQVFGVSVADIRGKRHLSAHTRARFAVCYLGRQLAGLSYPRIGRTLGDRDHSTIINGVQKCIAMMRRDPVYRAKVRRVRKLAKHSGLFGLVPRKLKPAPAMQSWMEFMAGIKPRPAPPPKPRIPPWWEMSDDEFIERRIAAHRERGGNFLEVW